MTENQELRAWGLTIAMLFALNKTMAMQLEKGVNAEHAKLVAIYEDAKSFIQYIKDAPKS